MTSLRLQVDDLWCARANRAVLSGVDLDAGVGDVLALVGPSGSGKTTVLRVIAGLDPFTRGSITVDGLTIAAPATGARARALLHTKIGMVFQFHHLFEHLAALDNVTLAPVHVQGMERGDAKQRAHRLLESLGVGHRALALPRELSGGEAQRVAIARALAVDPPVLLLDEPTASLDPARRDELAAILTGLAAQGRTLVVTSHDLPFVRRCATRVCVLGDGLVQSAGAPAEVLPHP